MKEIPPLSSVDATNPWVGLSTFTEEQCFDGLPQPARAFIEDELLTDTGFRENMALPNDLQPALLATSAPATSVAVAPAGSGNWIAAAAEDGSCALWKMKDGGRTCGPCGRRRV